MKKKNVYFFKGITSYIGFKSFKYLNRSDIIVIGGGGLFFDRKIFNPFFNHIINLFFIVLINNLLYKKKVYLFSVGASHLNSKISLFLTKYILNSSNIITVRDNLTREIFSKLTNKKISVFYDPAFLLKPKMNMEIDNLINKMGEKKILISVNSFILYKKKKFLIDLINTLDKKYSIFLYENRSFQNNALNFYNLNKKYLNSNNIYLLGENIYYSPEEIIYLLSKFNFIISAPMHSSIFAYNVNQKLYVYEYDFKVREFNNIIKNKNILNSSGLIDNYNILDNYYEIDYQKNKESILYNVSRGFKKIEEYIYRI